MRKLVLSLAVVLAASGLSAEDVTLPAAALIAAVFYACATLL